MAHRTFDAIEEAFKAEVNIRLAVVDPEGRKGLSITDARKTPVYINVDPWAQGPLRIYDVYWDYEYNCVWLEAGE